MNFSNALALMESGFRCTRQEWKTDGKDVWIGMVRASQPITIYNMPKSWLESGKNNSRLMFGDWIGIKTANDVFIPWEAAQIDVFADDWTVYDLVINDATPQVQKAAEAVTPDGYADATKFVSDKLNDTRTKSQRESEKEAMRAKVTGAINNGKQGSKPASKPSTSKSATNNKPTSRAESEKAAMRARMNKALNKR